MEREKNQFGDHIIEGRLTIKELYEIAKKEGFEDRTLFFSIDDPLAKGKRCMSTHHVVDFGKGWTKKTAIIHIKLDDEQELTANSPHENQG